LPSIRFPADASLENPPSTADKIKESAPWVTSLGTLSTQGSKWPVASNFPHQKTVNWVWSTGAAASGDAPGYAWVRFVHSFDVTARQDIPVFIHIVVDSVAKVYLNGKLVGEAVGGFGSGNAQYAVFQSTGKNSANVITVDAMNQDWPSGDAALAVAVIDAAGNLLDYTSSLWKFTLPGGPFARLLKCCSSQQSHCQMTHHARQLQVQKALPQLQTQLFCYS
jgi:hypothetical protein